MSRAMRTRWKRFAQIRVSSTNLQSNGTKGAHKSIQNVHRRMYDFLSWKGARNTFNFQNHFSENTGGFVKSAWTAIPSTWKGSEQRKRHKASTAVCMGGVEDHQPHRTWATDGGWVLSRETALDAPQGGCSGSRTWRRWLKQHKMHWTGRARVKRTLAWLVDALLSVLNYRHTQQWLGSLKPSS